MLLKDWRADSKEMTIPGVHGKSIYYYFEI